VCYVLSRNIRTEERLCKVTAHEIGHTLSLEHEYLCKDPMTYLSGCGTKSFQDQEASCGTYSAQRCRCRGGKQNTVQALYQLVGAASGNPRPDPADDLSPPQVDVVSPADGDTLEENSTVEVVATATDDLWLSRVELVWDHNGKVYGCPTSQQYVECTKNQDTYTWKIDVSSGHREFRVRAVDFAGKETVSDTRRVDLTVGGTAPPERTDFEDPVITVIGPTDGDTGPPSSTVVVEAEVTDDVAVEQVQLRWDYNGKTYGCPTNERYVNCEENNGRYAWTVSVGSVGDRRYSVRAVDTAGNEALTSIRSFVVADIVDNTAPTVEILEPADGAVLSQNSEIEVKIRVGDDVSVAATELVWDFNGWTYKCPQTSRYVDCTSNADLRNWKLRVGTGERVFRVRVVDSAGNVTSTDDRQIFLQ
jgi:hypothetical protein